MRIADSSLIMDATRSFVQKDEVKEQLRVWVDRPQTVKHDTVSLTEKARSLFDDMQTASNEMSVNAAGDEVSLKALIVEILSGRKIKILDQDDLSQEQTPPDIPQASTSQSQDSPERVGWGVQYIRNRKASLSERPG